MAVWLRSLATLFILAPLAAEFLGPFFAAVFDKLGWDTESWAAPFVEFMISISAYLGHPNAYIAVAFGLGVWVHWLVIRMDSTRPSKSDRFAGLCHRISNVKEEWAESFRTFSGEYDFTKPNRPADLKRQVLYAELGKVGVAVPNFDDLPRVQANIGHFSYLQSIEPFADRGLIQEAKREAKRVIAEVRSTTRGVKKTKDS